MTAGTGGDDLRRLASAARPVRGRLGAAVAAGTGAMLASIGLTATAAWLIARASERPPVLALGVAVVAVRFFGVARPVLRYAERLLSHDGALQVLGDLRAGVYAQLIPLTPARLGATGRGDLLARVVSDVDAAQDLQLRVVHPVAVAALVSAGCVGLAVAVLPSWAMVLAATFALAGVVAPVVAATVSRRAAALIAPGRAALAAAVVDLVDGAPDLIAMGAAPASLREIERLDTQATAAARRVAWCAGLGAGLASLAAGAAVLGSAVVGTSAVRSGALPGTVLAVLVLVPLTAFESLAALPPAAVLLTHVRTAARRLFALLDAEPAVTEPPTPLPPPAPPYGLDLRGVRARWARDLPPVLDGLSLTLPPGRSVAVVGESGSGKSTLAALMLRFLVAEEGHALLGGRELGGLASDDVHRVVGLVADDAHVFASTLRANLELARPGAEDAELVDALRRAHLGGWYDALPAGLDTALGRGGRTVSGGEQRRLALARVLLADQPVLVLDEPTEGLDEETAEAVVRDLLQASPHRTVVLLTHRTEGLDLVDEVHELRSGRLHRLC